MRNALFTLLGVGIGIIATVAFVNPALLTSAGFVEGFRYLMNALYQLEPGHYIKWFIILFSITLFSISASIGLIVWVIIQEKKIGTQEESLHELHLQISELMKPKTGGNK